MGDILENSRSLYSGRHSTPEKIWAFRLASDVYSVKTKKLICEINLTALNIQNATINYWIILLLFYYNRGVPNAKRQLIHYHSSSWLLIYLCDIDWWIISSKPQNSSFSSNIAFISEDENTVSTVIFLLQGFSDENVGENTDGRLP